MPIPYGRTQLTAVSAANAPGWLPAELRYPARFPDGGIAVTFVTVNAFRFSNSTCAGYCLPAHGLFGGKNSAGCSRGKKCRTLALIHGRMPDEIRPCASHLSG